MLTMYERIKSGANLLESHVFQFDFLNDPFTKLPHGLQDIINDPAKREKLVIYINPPYAEVSSKKTTKEGRKGKTGVNKSIVHNRYHELLGTASREVFCLFLARIYAEIPSTTLAIFSTLKILQGSAFFGFLQYFRADLKSLFVVPADTFDNVKGKFPIGFFIWDTSKNDPFISIKADVYDSRSNMIGMKTFERYDRATYINRWISLYKNDGVNAIGYMDGINGNDFQHNNIVYILNSKTQIKNPRGIWINQNNLIPCCVYLAVRKCIESTWLNDRDQFLIPDSSWIEDTEFQYDCLAYTLFNNNIQSSEGTNHWIPFTEQEIGAKDCFKSRFMSNFIKGALADNQEILLFSETDKSQTAISFSKEAEEVMKAGKEIYKYYHSQESSIPDASFYDIKLFFQGRNNKGVMNQDSSDSEYMKLLNILKTSTKQLAQKIALSVYKYGFLKQ